MSDDTMAHIERVQALLGEVCRRLQERAKAHDASKLREPERSGFAKLTADLRAVGYMSDDYRAALQEAKPVVEHHYKQNDHHPEHYANGVADMSLLALLEMLADWKAASERVKGGSLQQSLAANQQRFGYDPAMAALLERTARELGWLSKPKRTRSKKR